jgi:hypothetical protein
VTPDLLGRAGIVRDAEGRYCIYLQRVGEQLNVLPEPGTYRSLDEAPVTSATAFLCSVKSYPCLEHFAPATLPYTAPMMLPGNTMPVSCRRRTPAEGRDPSMGAGELAEGNTTARTTATTWCAAT